MAAAKPDCTGQKFGYLTVTEKAEVVRKNGKSRRLWLLECVCGKRIKVTRANFDRKGGGQKSCGCMKYKSPHLGIKPQNLSGQRFGYLVAIAIVPGKISPADNSKVWLCQCDCGARVKKSVKRLHSNYGLHCSERNLTHIPYANYPPAPVPYPSDAGDIATKYLHLVSAPVDPDYQFGDTHMPRNSFNAEVEDERMDRLLRAAWILAYRIRQGEFWSELRQKRFIRKHLRYAQTDVYWRHRLEVGGGLAYNYLDDAIKRRK